MKPDGYRRVRPERVDSYQRKPWQRGGTRKEDQGRTFRLETRAGEFTAVASLRGKTRKQRETNTRATRKSQAQGLKGPGVTAVQTRNQTIYPWAG